MPAIKYIFFDCDNTLVQSERLAFEACADLTNELLEKYKIDARYTGESLLHEFVGQNFRGMMVGLQEKHNFSMDPQELDEYVAKEVDRVVAKLLEKAVVCPGANVQVEALHGKIPMAVVSTSAKPRVIASLVKTGLGNGKYWSDDHVYSAATSLTPPSSKPDPKIYNYAAEQLNVPQANVVAVEDSKSGATAAMRAGIPCIAYVGIYGIEEGPEKMEEMAKLLTDTCKCFAVMRDWKEFPDILKKHDSSLVGKI